MNISCKQTCEEKCERCNGKKGYRLAITTRTSATSACEHELTLHQIKSTVE